MSIKTRVAVIYGGRTGEHEISLRSALTIMSAMDPERYEIVPIGIGRDGRWYLKSDALKMLRQETPRLGALKSGGMLAALKPTPLFLAATKVRSSISRSNACIPER